MIRLCVIQFAPVFGNKQVNLETIRTLTNDIESDIILLPELCTTGYSFLTPEEVAEQAEDAAGETAMLLQQIAEEKKAMVIAGFAEQAADGCYNSAMIAAPGQPPHIYRKTHLFYKEKLAFKEGNLGFTVYKHPLKDVKVGVMICNDWRYPEAARSLALKEADIIACPSNLVSSLWQKVMPARAFENKVYLAVANRYGEENRALADGQNQQLNFSGGSVCYDCFGDPIASAGPAGDAVLSIEFDPMQARDKSFNPYNDLLADRRPQYYF